MKKSALFLVPVALAGLVLAGCASTRPTGEPAARNRNYQPDTQYMAAVENAAKHMPVKIIWINPPEKKAGTSDK